MFHFDRAIDLFDNRHRVMGCLSAGTAYRWWRARYLRAESGCGAGRGIVEASLAIGGIFVGVEDQRLLVCEGRLDAGRLGLELVMCKCRR